MSKKHSVLYVDDESMNLMLFELNFQDHFNILLAESGIDGLKILDQDPEIDIIISDMKMPGMSGLEFIQTAKNKYPKKHCFMLTGFNITDEISAAIQEKLILKCFSKPFELDDILTTINTCMDA